MSTRTRSPASAAPSSRSTAGPVTRPVLARRLRRRHLCVVRRRDERARDLRRVPLPARHGQGLRPRQRRRPARPRLQLRLQPVLRLDPRWVCPLAPPGTGSLRPCARVSSIRCDDAHRPCRDPQRARRRNRRRRRAREGRRQQLRAARATSSSVVLTCADANYELAGLKWSGWTTGSARRPAAFDAERLHPELRGRQVPLVPGHRSSPTGSDVQVEARLSAPHADLPGQAPGGPSEREAWTFTCASAIHA